ncbi:MAG: hypothetical protein NTX83_08220, partial [Burkholderiales bacterium]|nr:hypothetical protein [Burkholderiales bacterium]
MADNLLTYFRWVESKNNDLVKQLMAHQVGGRSAAKLRKEQNLTLLEGTHLLDSWYRAGHSTSLKTIITNPVSLEIPEVKELITGLVNDSMLNSVLSYDFVLLKESLVKAV